VGLFSAALQIASVTLSVLLPKYASSFTKATRVLEYTDANLQQRSLVMLSPMRAPMVFVMSRKQYIDHALWWTYLKFRRKYELERQIPFYFTKFCR